MWSFVKLPWNSQNVISALVTAHPVSTEKGKQAQSVDGKSVMVALHWEMGNYRDSKKIRSCHGFMGKRGGMSRWSTGDFSGSETMV